MSYYAQSVHDTKLRDLLMRGIGYHHAGLEPQDRKTVEQLFAQGDLPILACTTTLAQGVNLPAHLVIIKGTSQLIAGTTKEYDSGQIQQMIGRAGRPQFDTSATALILTKASSQRYYENLMSGNNCIESCLHKRMAEHINAEIVLGNIKTKEEAIKWAKISYLFVRIFKNPKLYNLLGTQEEDIHIKFEELILKTLHDLHQINIIRLDPSSGALGSNIIGGVMARFNIAFKTMQNLNDASGVEDIPGILSIFSLSEEYSNFVLRRNEKEVLNTLNKPVKQKQKSIRGIKYPFQGKIKTPSMKISVLIQASFDCLQISDTSLSREASMCIHVGQRISKAFMELLWNTPPDPSRVSLLVNAITLAQCFQSGLWEDSPYVAKQFSRIGITYSTLLAQAGFNSFQKILSANARSIELATNRPPPFGNHLMHSAAKMPVYTLTFRDNEAIIIVEMENIESEDRIQDHIIFILAYQMEENSGMRLLSKQRISDSKLPHTIHIPKAQLTNAQELHVQLISSSFCGLDLHQQFTIRGLTKTSSIQPSSPKLNTLSSNHKHTTDPLSTSFLDFSELNQSFIDTETLKVTKTPHLPRQKLPKAITFDIDFDESMPDWENEHLLQEMLPKNKNNSSSENKKNFLESNTSLNSSTRSTKSLSEISVITMDTLTDISMGNNDSISIMETSSGGNDRCPKSPQKYYMKSPYFNSRIFKDISIEKRLGLI